MALLSRISILKLETHAPGTRGSGGGQPGSWRGTKAAFPSGQRGVQGEQAKAWEENPKGSGRGSQGWETPLGGRDAEFPHTGCSEPLLGLAAREVGSQDDLGKLGPQFLRL